MNLSFFITLYLALAICAIPILLIGYLITPELKKRPPKIKTPKRLLKDIRKSQKTFASALKTFQTHYISSSSCDEDLWLKMIEDIFASKWLQEEESNALKEKLISQNPEKDRQIEQLINSERRNK
ncbi:hypothetical protein BBW65_06355 [Helicobacter enhydrae]|uniref:Uncharacterized protein n=1 Tax=Helicobacter enhydrae TaxID=222136 RepID=A0A1B1U6Q3_9HELI|nr:hypothetical protein [Helicobacter enhydrae]ANV98439.1 hypothetical protein BBW65_06355 [Helicobacter enhydrae]